MSYTRTEFVFGETRFAGLQRISLGNRIGATPQNGGTEVSLAVQDSDIALKTGSTITGDFVFNGANLVMSGAELVDGRDVSVDGAVLDAINSGTGFLARTGAGTFAARTLTGSADISVTNGAGTAGNPTVGLSDTTVTPGSYRAVTVDAKGRVIGGTNPTTLASYGITDAQPLDSDLTALANTTTLGLYAITGTGSSATRQIVGTLDRITVTNPTGASGNPTIDLALSGVGAGTYKSVTVDLYGRVTAGTNPTTLAEYGISDAQPLDSTLTAVAGLSANGFIARTGSGTVATRTLNGTSGRVTVTNGDGLANPTIDLATVGTGGNFSFITLDAYGRGVSGGQILLTGDVGGSINPASGVITTALATSGVMAGTYINPSITVDAKGRVTAAESAVAPIASYAFAAGTFDNPVNSNWAVNALAPAVADTANPALIVRSFDDTTEEGIGFLTSVPSNATNMTLRFKGRAATAPLTARQVILRLYSKRIPDNAAVAAWSAATQLTAIDIPTNAFYQYDSQTTSLAALGLVAGDLYLFELTRHGANAADTLAGDYQLIEMICEFN